MRNTRRPHGSAGVVTVQQLPGPLCVDCGTPVERGRRVSSQVRRCATCHRSHRRRAQLRAYIVCAAKLATELGEDELAIALRRLREL